MPDSGRRTAVLTAAVEVLGSAGARGLTHRAVDAAAGVPAGTTSNHFRTRDALVRGVLEHITALEAAPIPDVPPNRDALVALAAERLRFLLADGRTLALARHALFLEAAVRPELRAPLLDASRYWWALGARLLGALGVADAEARSRWLFAYLDGLLIDQLARPDVGFDADAAVRAALAGLLRP